MGWVQAASPVTSHDRARMTPDPAPSDLGTKLHRARESRGVSLSRIADATKIPIAILRALEHNDISLLPGGVIGRGFVRSFATEVGLDPEATVTQLVAQFPTDSVTVGYPRSERPAQNEVVETRRSAPRTLLVLTGGVVLLAAFPVYFATRARTRNHAVVRRLSDAAMTEAARSQLAPPPIMAGAPMPVRVPTGSAAPSAAVVSAAPEPPPADGIPAAVPEIPAPQLTSTTTAGSIAAARADENPSTEKPATEQMGRLVVVLAALRPSWVIATVDGQKSVNRLLDAGERETFTGDDVVVTAGDAGAIVIKVNEATERPLGRTGETLTAHLNRTNLKKYLAER